MANQAFGDLVISGKVRQDFRWNSKGLVNSLALGLLVAVVLIIGSLVGDSLGFWSILHIHPESIYLAYYCAAWTVVGLGVSFIPSLFYTYWASVDEKSANSNVSGREHEIVRTTLLMSGGKGVIVPIMTSDDEYNVSLSYTALGLMGESRQETYTVNSEKLYKACREGDCVAVSYRVVYRQSKLYDQEVEMLAEVTSPK